jgi:hypothetical protein
MAVGIIIVALGIFLLIRSFTWFKNHEMASPAHKDRSFCFTKIVIQATHCPNRTSEVKKA